MGWREHTYRVAIERNVDVARLAVVDASKLEAADEAGYLAGNAMFQDLSACTWDEAAASVVAEAQFFDRLRAATDEESEAERIDEERTNAFDDAESLWNLDVGVIGAVTALSAMGCVSVGSCNAGGFGANIRRTTPTSLFTCLPRLPLSCSRSLRSRE